MIYLLKASLVLSIFYIIYSIFLQKETFYQSNRWYLALGLLGAFAIPLIYLKQYVIVTPVLLEPVAQGAIITTYETAKTIDWFTLLVNSYWAVTAVLFLKLLWQLFAVIRIIGGNTKEKHQGYNLIYTHKKMQPFSFFQNIVINTSNYTTEELKQIVSHEKVHVTQWHSLDLLTAHFVCVLLWFNPLTWMYKKSLEQNLEYIADGEAQYSISPRAYQYTLLKTAIPDYQMALTNNFFNSLIKKRIMMLNKQKSKSRNHLKMALVLPFLALFLMSFNVKTVPVLEDAPVTNAIVPIAIQNDIVITKDMSDAQLDAITEKMDANGITLKFKNVKRNKAGEITKISITAKSKNTTADLSQSDDDGIEPITINIEDGSISFGDAKHNTHDEDYHISHNDGKVEIIKSKGGNSVFIYSDKNEVVDEVIEEDDKIIIKRNGKMHEIKKGKGNSFILEGDDDDIEVITEGKHVVIRESKDGKGTKVHVDHDEDNVWVTEQDHDVKIKTIGKGKDKLKVFISGDGEDTKDPIYIIDGKEVKESKMKDLEPDQIESINVLKGKSAIDKYGKKGKHGVIEITMKKN